MTTPTPRTDAAERECGDLNGLYYCQPLSRTARQLERDLAAAREARQRTEAIAEEAIAIAILLFDAWEDGTPCFETDGESGMGASFGNAFKLSDDDFTRCVEFLNRVDPRGTAIDAAREGK